MSETGKTFNRCYDCGHTRAVVIQSGRYFYSNGYCNACGAARAARSRLDPATRERGREIDRRYYARHRDRRLSSEKDRARKRKLLVLDHYGGKCACCNEAAHEFLAIDHIYGDGGAHRKSLGKMGTRFYQWIIKEGFPSGFRVLCHNCNFSLGRHGYCPHGNVRVEVRESAENSNG